MHSKTLTTYLGMDRRRSFQHWAFPQLCSSILHSHSSESPPLACYSLISGSALSTSREKRGLWGFVVCFCQSLLRRIRVDSSLLNSNVACVPAAWLCEPIL